MTIRSIYKKKNKNPPKTTLIGFFELCRSDNFATTLLYSEVPAYYTWQNNKFVRRKQGKAVPGHHGVKKDQVLGRVYTVHPNNAECYYLRLLLHEVKGPTSFEDLKRVSGVVHPTFQSACRELGLLQDDNHWANTLEEAAVSESPSKIRQLSAVILVFCQAANPLALWEKHRDSMSEDFRRQMEGNVQGLDGGLLASIAYNKCLETLETLLYSMAHQSLLNFGLPSPTTDNSVSTNREYLRELSYNVDLLSNMVADNEPKLNDEQRTVYSEVITSVLSDNGQLFFLDAPGGTGKTFLLNLILARVRKDKNIAVSVASSGIAATLLDGGKTAHSAFKLPLNLNHQETPICNIPKQSDSACSFACYI